MRIQIINGPNLNLLGKREPHVYGGQTFEAFFQTLTQSFPQVELHYFQSNVEGDLVNIIQEVGFEFDGIILNAGAYTHTSIAILDSGVDPNHPDLGQVEVVNGPDSTRAFRTPSLRNVALSAPYMHNGKFKTLESVLDHYASGVKDSPTLDPVLRQAGGSLGIPLDATEKTQLIAFLNTLTDESFLRDERFAQ